jgi:hypothetical protein
VSYTRDVGTLSMKPRYNGEESARRADEIFEREIQPKLLGEDENKFLAIDLVTGDYEVARDELLAADAVIARHPDAQIWLRRVGSRHLHRLGFHRKTAYL